MSVYEEMVHEGQSFMKGDGHGTIRPGANSTDNPNSMRGGGSGQQRHHLPELEPSVSIVSNVSTATMDHPSKLLNQFLWTNSGHKYPSARVVITEDKDWISVLRDDDLTLPDSEELYRRITAQEQTSGSFLSASFGWRRGDKEHESDSGGNQCYDHKDAGNVYGHCNTHTQRNYTTTSNTAFSMSSGNNILITGRPEFKTINGEYNTYVNTTQTTNVNSNNVIGNTLTNTLYDNSQVIHVKGRGRTRQVRRERRYGRDNVTVNEGHQANAFPPPTSFPTQFPPSHFPGLPNSTTWSSGYVQTFPPPFATPLSSFTHTEDGIVFNIAPGDVEGMGEQSSQLFLKLFGALEAEHFVQAESSTTIPTALAPAASYGSDNSTQSTTYIDLTSGSSYSSPLADNRTAPIEAEMASLSIDEPVQTFVASPFGGQHAAHPDYGASPIESDMAGLSISDPVQTNNAMSPVVAGMANLSLNRPAQSNYALPADGVSAMLKGTILSAASMPDNNVQTSSGRPRIDTRSETPLYGPPATHFTSTLFDSPVSQSPSTHPFLPAQRQTVPTLSYRQSTVSDFGGVQIAPGAHVTSMTFNGLYNEVNHRQTTVNHGMSGMVIGNTVTHVQNLVGEVKEGTTPRKLGKQAHIPMKGKRWAM
ncbi:hypothetical protein CPC08DRAFT_343744 [Agrocybe pediades]|nr:hypothetical protein CPC08DRAFT_343744 [Agrocybe pediades]